MISKKELEKHHCYERSDYVSGDPETAAFRRRARLHQAQWRMARNLKEGTQPINPKPGQKSRPIGSNLNLVTAGNSNFLTEATAMAAEWRLGHPEPHQMLDANRLKGNLLSSMPMCFNLFGPLFSTSDFKLADAAVHSWWPDTPGRVCAVRFEWSPGRLKCGEFLENRTAFDAAFEVELDDGAKGVIGIETKYHEHPEKEKPPNSKRLSRYSAVTERAGIYKPGALQKIIGTHLQQIWLDHLLALSMLQHSSRAWTWARFALVHPEKNPSFARAAKEYQALLRDSSTFEVRTIESLLDCSALPSRAVEAFRERYL